MRFAKSELFVIKLIVTLVALIMGLSWAKGITVDYSSFSLAIGVCTVLLAIGQFYRRVRIHEPLAASVNALGLAFLLAQFAGALNYLYLPYIRFGVDQQLAVYDAAMGYVWSDFVTYFADYTLLLDVLRTVYMSSLWQILTVILFLGLASKTDDLHAYLVTLSLGLLICISIWSIFPSSSPVAFQQLPDIVAEKLNLVFNAARGFEVQKLATEGITHFPPKVLEGVIGFPSFHTVMLVATVYAVRNLKLIFWPALLWNLMMFPAILIHGAHNLVDVFAGIAVAVFCIYCRNKVTVPDSEANTIQPLADIKIGKPA